MGAVLKVQENVDLLFLAQKKNTDAKTVNAMFLLTNALFLTLHVAFKSHICVKTVHALKIPSRV